MNLCDDLAESLRISSNMKNSIFELIETELSEEKKIKLNEIFQKDDLINQKLQRVLFYLCLEKDIDYFKYGFAEPAITIDDKTNCMSKEEIEALIQALEIDSSDNYY